MKRTYLTFALGFVSLLLMNPAFAGSPETFNFQGQVVDSSDVPVNSNNVDLIFSIYNPAMDCLLYEERQNFDLSASEGHFSASLGSATGAGKRSGTNDPNLSMLSVFKNGGMLRSSSSPNCAPGYTSTSGDVRKLKITVENVSGSPVNEVLSAIDIQSVPWAKVADSAVSLSPIADVNLNNVRITNLVSPAAGTDAVNKTYADTNLKGIAISGAPAPNDVLKYNGSNWVMAQMTGGGSVTGVTATPPVQSSGGSAPVISLPQATGGTDGYLSSGDWNAFNTKLGTSLANGQIWIGNGGVASPQAITGDIALSPSGVTSYNATVPVSRGGTGTTFFASNKVIVSNGGGVLEAFTSCTINQVLAFDGTGNAVCSNISSLITPAGTNGQIQFNLGGTTVGASSNLFWDNTNGRLGVGTQTPSAKLHIVGSGGANEIVVDAWGTFRSSGSVVSSDLIGLTINNTAQVGGEGAGIVLSANNNSTAPTPAAKIIGRLSSNSNGSEIGDLIFSTTKNPSPGHTEKMRITGDGKVGIGTAAPTDFLEVQGSSTGESGLRVQNTNSTGTSATKITAAFGGYNISLFANSTSNSGAPGGVNSVGIKSGGSSPIIFAPGNFEKMRIDTAGNLGIGTASPSRLLHVGSPSVGSATPVANFENVDGMCTITPASSGSGIACSSDERLKENFQDITASFIFDRLLKLQAVTYNFKTSSDSNRKTGYRAQEVQKIAPEFVRENEDGMLQVYYDAFIPWITEAIKTLYIDLNEIKASSASKDREIAELKSLAAKAELENAELKSRLDKIEKMLNSK